MFSQKLSSENTLRELVAKLQSSISISWNAGKFRTLHYNTAFIQKLFTAKQMIMIFFSRLNLEPKKWGLILYKYY